MLGTLETGIHTHTHIRGAFQDNFPGFSGFGFFRKLALTKNQQGKYKARKQNGRRVFTGIWYCLRAHQQEWFQYRLIVYPLFILFSQ